MENPTSQQLFWHGYRATIPLMFGVAPFGFVFGALAVSAEMTVLEALGMSVLVLAGSSQFVAAQLIGDHTPALIIVLTTFIINLRHFLYSASLAEFFRPVSRGWKALLGYMMVDEVYAVVVLRKGQGDLSPYQLRWYFFGSAANLISLWWTTTVVGALVGDVLPENMRVAMGFTLPLVFTAIVVPGLANRPLFWVASSAFVTGILLAPLPHRLGLLVAAGIGILVGVFAEVRQIRREGAQLD